MPGHLPRNTASMIFNWRPGPSDQGETGGS